MNHIVARASVAFKANEVALEHPDEVKVLHEDEPPLSAEAVQAGLPQGQKQMRHGMPSSKSLKNLRTAAAHTVNLRDCGTISSILRQGRMFRSSQVMRCGVLVGLWVTPLRSLQNILLEPFWGSCLICPFVLCSSAEIAKLGIKVGARVCERYIQCQQAQSALHHNVPYFEQDCCHMQSVLDLRIMRKDCKKEAKDFHNSIEELAYTVGQVRYIGFCCLPMHRW